MWMECAEINCCGRRRRRRAHFNYQTVTVDVAGRSKSNGWLISGRRGQPPCAPWEPTFIYRNCAVAFAQVIFYKFKKLCNYWKLSGNDMIFNFFVLYEILNIILGIEMFFLKKVLHLNFYTKDLQKWHPTLFQKSRCRWLTSRRPLAPSFSTWIPT